MSSSSMTAQHRKDRLMLWLLLAPCVIILAGFMLLFFWGVYQSMTDFRLGRSLVRFVGLENYLYLFGRPDFIQSIARTGQYAFLAVSIEAILGLMIAKLFASGAFLARWCRPVILLPLVLPPMSVALMWTTMMDPQTGVLNYLLTLVHLPAFSWISDPRTAMASIVFIDVWTFTPFFALICFSALRGITPDIIEAARINGAKEFRIFISIEFPLVLPYILIAALFRAIDSLNQFDIIFGTTQGGPGNSTNVLSVSSYLTAFQNLDFGRGAAMMVVNWFMVLVISTILVRLWQAARRKVS